MAGTTAEYYLGLATNSTQLQRTIGFCAVWFGASILGERFAPDVIKDQERTRFGARLASLIHSTTTSVFCLYIILYLNPESINVDRIDGYSDAVNSLFAISCSYFVWDIYNECRKPKLEWPFLIHGIACFLCYLFGQFPYLHYYGVRFLCFEFSTPFLNVMLLLRQIGLGHTLAHQIAQTSFGYTFLAIRIFWGLPLSYAFFEEVLQSGRVHPTLPFITYYYMAANACLNGLNLFWAVSLLQKRLKSS